MSEQIKQVRIDWLMFGSFLDIHDKKMKTLKLNKTAIKGYTGKSYHGNFVLLLEIINKKARMFNSENRIALLTSFEEFKNKKKAAAGKNQSHAFNRYR